MKKNTKAQQVQNNNTADEGMDVEAFLAPTVGVIETELVSALRSLTREELKTATSAEVPAKELHRLRFNSAKDELRNSTVSKLNPGDHFILGYASGPEANVLYKLLDANGLSIAFNTNLGVFIPKLFTKSTEIQVHRPMPVIINNPNSEEPKMKKNTKKITTEKTTAEPTDKAAAAPVETQDAEEMTGRIENANLNAKAEKKMAKATSEKAPKKSKKTTADVTSKAPATTGRISSRIRELLADNKNKGFIINAIAAEFYQGNTDAAGRRTRALLRKIAKATGTAPVAETANEKADRRDANRVNKIRKTHQAIAEAGKDAPTAKKATAKKAPANA